MPEFRCFPAICKSWARWRCCRATPDRFRPEHLTLLETLGRQVVTRLELYSRIRMQEQAQRQRQRTERALAIERCFVAATLDSIPALVTVLDTAGRVVRMNEPCSQLTGLSLAHAIGLPFVEEFLEERDRSWVASKLREAVVGLASGPHETAWRAVGGSWRRVSWTLRPLQGPTGEIQYLIVSGQDVTDQRAMEKALLSSEARYREMVENSLGFVFTCSMEGRLTSLNAFTAETLGYRPEDLLGRMVTELMDATGVATFQDCLNTVETDEEWQGALSLRRSDGVFRRITVHSRGMQLAGERSFAIVHGMDVTEQYKAEEALRVATRQRELILESVGDGIFGIDLDGRVTFINEAGASILGYAPEQLKGRDLHQLIHHSHADGTPYSRSTSPILQALRRAEPIRMRDEVFWRRNGSAIQVEYSANPLIEDGRVSGMVVAFQDVSERRRLERMKDEFISTVSHELRTPLTSLRASLGLIQSGALDKRPEKQRQMVEMAIGNCDRLTRLVNDILDFDGAEKRRLPLHREPVEAIDLLRRAADVAHVRGDAGAHGVPHRCQCVAGVCRLGARDAGAERAGDERDQVLAAGDDHQLSARDAAGTDRVAARWNERVGSERAGSERGVLHRRGPGARHCAGEAGADLRALSSRATRRTRGRWAGRDWAWRFAAASWSSMAGASGLRAKWAKEAGSCLRCRRQKGGD